MTDKATLRKALITQRLALPDRLTRDASLQQLLRIWLIQRHDTVIAGYWPIKGEFDPLPALHRWQEAASTDPDLPKRTVTLPVMHRDTKTLTFHAWWPGCPMEDDAFGLPKPKDTEELHPTLVLVPCVGYGMGRVRLGYGGGFFDRTLATLKPRPYTLGISYSIGFVSELMGEPHDVPMDAVMTDAGER
jgi:5-formyltetrahydrofolate cyclo-ligase